MKFTNQTIVPVNGWEGTGNRLLDVVDVDGGDVSASHSASAELIGSFPFKFDVPIPILAFPFQIQTANFPVTNNNFYDQLEKRKQKYQYITNLYKSVA